MDVLIVHYHLYPGGVTRIIEAQIKGLQMHSEIMNIKVLCGNSNGLSKILNCPIEENDLLEYSDFDSGLSEMYMKSLRISEIIVKNLSENTIIHCHNAGLGKNPALLFALYNLAAKGIPVIYHCHDFAEDRPDNLHFLNRIISGISSLNLNEVLYPGFAVCKFIVLTSCDYQRILNMNVSSEQVRWIPNPVSDAGTFSDPYERNNLRRIIYNNFHLIAGKSLCLYPVRAIERKNIGEFILLAVLFADSHHFIISQPPRNPKELPLYLKWKNFCSEQSIPMVFEAGERVDFHNLMKVTDYCVTTSYREGFGMAFLEPWLYGVPVTGRELPCIVNDLTKSGLQFPKLYNKLQIPGTNRDFFELSVSEQQNLIAEIKENDSKKRQFLEINYFLEDLFKDFPVDIAVRNREMILQQFSINNYGSRLFAMYREIFG